MDFKKEFFKYFQYWPWFLLSLILCVGAAFYYIKTVEPTYQTTALIYIDKKEEQSKKIITNTKDDLTKDDSLNEEIVLITSNDFLSEVVKSLELNINYFENRFLQNVTAKEVPFVIKPTVSLDSLPNVTYTIKIVKEGFIITSPSIEKSYLVRANQTNQVLTAVPFTIQFTAQAKKKLPYYQGKEFVVSIEPIALAVKKLKTSLTVKSFDDLNTNLLLNHEGTDPVLSRKILDELIVLLDKNIVINKQKKFNNTVSYLNQRIKFFSKDKDSIERVKEKYLQNNDILVLDQYIINKTSEKNSKTENSLLNEKQISLTRLAINDIRKSNLTTTLGTDYNLDAPTVNQLLSNYNKVLLESELLLQRAQKNNPAYISLNTQLKVQKQTILSTLEDYLSYLNQTNIVNRTEKNIANSEAHSIPTKNKVLGNINNDLSLKEETYLVLLQKREEAILNGAALESNIRTLNSAQTNYSPVFPKPKSFMLGSFMLGLLFPLGIVYFNLKLDTKIHNEEDIQKEYATIPFLGYVPKVSSDEKFDNTASSRSTIAEATRSLYSNISYLLPKKAEQKAAVLLFTSSIQGEGKTFCAFHNAITISNLNKKVLLIGSDLRNPQLHDYFNVKKSDLGLSNFLSNKSDDWKDLLVKDTRFSDSLDTLFSGEIPPNPTQLLTNSNFELLIEEAKNLYDFIIIDSAPVLMVSDTLNFSHLADVTVYITRYDFTESRTLAQINNFIKKGQLKNVGLVINGVTKQSSYGYNYGATYSYGYQEKSVKKSWFKKAIA